MTGRIESDYLLFLQVGAQAKPISRFLFIGDNTVGRHSRNNVVVPQMPASEDVLDFHAIVCIEEDGDNAIEALAEQHGVLAKLFDGRRKELRGNKVYELREGVAFFLGKHVQIIVRHRHRPERGEDQ